VLRGQPASVRKAPALLVVQDLPAVPLSAVRPAFPGHVPRLALIGAIAIGTGLLLLPATRPEWLTLQLAPRAVVQDRPPVAALAPREPPAQVQIIAGTAGAKTEGDAPPSAQRGTATRSPTPGGTSAAADVPAVAVQPERGTAAARPGPEPTSAQVVLAASTAPDGALSSAPAGGAISALAAYDAGDTQRAERMARCDPELSNPAPPAKPASLGPGAFGKALAEAALQQTRGFGIYTDSYRRIAFPMGDVPALFGVCTDVVIRAYRTMGIDLQARIHAARVGSLDPSIAHRRTYTLRRYFASRGASLPITDFAEDYLPGDIVTYYRPQNSGSQDHIAIVADQTGPSGRPMIIHNRGWGAQIEDALFVDKITGHYRYAGAEPALAKIKVAALGSLPKAKAAEKATDMKRINRDKAARLILKIRSERRNGAVKR
jgi:uncharacterized protein YijF (DUF1287 family)